MMTEAPDRTRHLLLVDDEAITVLALERFLVRRGFRVSTAGNGEEALDLAEKDPPDLVVTDIRMPRLSGAELVRRLRGRLPTLPVIVVTGYMADDPASAGLAQPGITVLSKPLDPVDLLRRVECLLPR